MAWSISFLGLDPESQDVTLALIDASARASSEGIAVLVATDPLQLLRLDRGAHAVHLVVIDNVDSSIFDVPYLISLLKARRNLAVSVVVRDHRERMSAQAAGADICLELPLHADAFMEHARKLLRAYDGRSSFAQRADVDVHFPRLNPAGMVVADATGAGDESRDSANAADSSGMTPHEARRQRSALERTPEPPKAWRLAEHGWLLISDEGNPISLGKRERQFIESLFISEDASLTHEQYCKLIGADVNDIQSARALSVVVNRLRRKCLAAGSPLPLRSDRGRGYCFTAACLIEQRVEKPTPRWTERTRLGGSYLGYSKLA